MISFGELIVSFIVALIYVLLFKLQKEMSPNSYFSMSDIFGEIEYSPSFKEVLIRIIIMLSYGITLYHFLNSQVIVVLGMTIGSFLIVWPVFLSDSNIDERLLDKKTLLYTFLSLFIITTYLIAKLSIVLFDVASELLFIYFNNFNAEKLINLIGDSIIWLALTVITSFVSSLMKNVLKQKMNIQS